MARPWLTIDEQSLDLPRIDVAEIVARVEEVGAEVLADDPKMLWRRTASCGRGPHRQWTKRSPAAR